MTHSVEHIPADMTVKVNAGIMLTELQESVRRGGQWLPIDPPGAKITVAEILSKNLSGPRRFGYGTIRDYVIGLTTRLADGQVIKSGGNVVKNVAGYDLQKLFIGANGTLGEIIEAIFKLRPIPEVERIVKQTAPFLAAAGKIIDAVWECPITPVILDLHGGDSAVATVILGFDGTKDEVEWQLEQARALGFGESATLDYETNFWNSPPTEIGKKSVLPSKLIETIEQSSGGKFLARAGNGILYRQGMSLADGTQAPRHLWQRAKTAYDPKGILPSLPS